MARMIKCPRCQSQIDVTNVIGGSTVPCADCGVMLRVPTGQTGVHPRVPSPAPQPSGGPPAAATKPRERQTALFRKMAGVRSPADRHGVPRPVHAAGPRSRSSGPVIAIVAGVAIVGLIGLLVLAMVSKSKQREQAAREAEERREKARAKAAAEREAVKRQEREWQEEAEREAARRAAQAGSKPPSLVRIGAGKYKAPDTFEPGAGKLVNELDIFKLDDALRKEYEGLASAGRVADIVKDDHKWMPYIISSLLTDDEKVARSTFQALHDICAKHNISSAKEEQRFVNPIKLEYFNSSHYRSGEYGFWSEWWSKPNNQAAVQQWATGATLVGEDPDRVKWDEIIKDLKSGGGYDEPDRPAGRAYHRIKLMGPKAYPHLVKYIDNEDIMVGRAVVALFNYIFKKDSPLPTESNKAQIKAEWENRIK